MRTSNLVSKPMSGYNEEHVWNHMLLRCPFFGNAFKKEPKYAHA